MEKSITFNVFVLSLIYAFLSFSTSKEICPISLEQLKTARVARYLVSIQENVNEKGPNHICSGTLITNSWVLTPAHCVFDKSIEKPKSPSVLFVSHVNTIGGAFIAVKKLHVHEDYSCRMCSSDVALLQTSKLLNVTSFTDDIEKKNLKCQVQTIGIPEEKLFGKREPYQIFSKPCYTIAWVKRTNDKFGAMEMRLGREQLISHKKCKETWPTIEAKHMCTYCLNDKSKRMVTSNCRVSPGAALICAGVQIGTESVQSCNQTEPTIWVRLDKHAKWISDIIEELGPRSLSSASSIENTTVISTMPRATDERQTAASNGLSPNYKTLIVISLIFIVLI